MPKRRALLDDREKRKNEGTLRKAPGQKRSAVSPPRKAPAKKRKLVKNGKGVKEPTPSKEFVPPPITHEAEVMIEEPVNPASPSISSGSGHVAGLNHSGPSASAVARLAILAEEAASINHPGSLHPDGDAAEALCATPMEETRVESQSQPSDDPNRLALVLVKGPPSKRSRSARNLKSGLIGRLQDRLQEIEDFASRRKDIEDQLRLRLEGAEASLYTVREDNEALRVDLAEAKNREESTVARLHEAEDEIARLRGEVRQLRTEASIEKKQRRFAIRW
ncbi:hypothetical protein AAG906_003693 [Vitis piasezkii]